MLIDQHGAAGERFDIFAVVAGEDDGPSLVEQVCQ